MQKCTYFQNLKINAETKQTQDRLADSKSVHASVAYIFRIRMRRRGLHDLSISEHLCAYQGNSTQGCLSC